MNVFSACVKAGLMAPIFLSAALAIAEPSLPAAPDPLSSVGKVVIFLLLIVGLILLLAWLVNKTQRQRLGGGNAKLKMVAVLPLGMKEKIAVVQVGSKQLLVGMTPQQITTLAELDEPLTLDEGAGSVSFQDLLKKAIRS